MGASPCPHGVEDALQVPCWWPALLMLWGWPCPIELLVAVGFLQHPGASGEAVLMGAGGSRALQAAEGTLNTLLVLTASLLWGKKIRAFASALLKKMS